MWRLKSFTYYFNIALILLGLFLPGISESIRAVLISTASGNIMLREKTQRRV